MQHFTVHVKLYAISW